MIDQLSMYLSFPFVHNNIDVVFRAAPYVISNNGTYCFINEVSGSLYDLI